MKRILTILLLLLCFIQLVPAQITFVIESVPPKTPSKDTLFMSTSLNGWNPCDKSYAFKPDGKGKYSLSIKVSVDSFEYKIVRGGWRNAEVDSTGRCLKNRFYSSTYGDRVSFKINGWRDLLPKQKSTATKGVSFVPTNIEIPQLSRNRTIRMYFPPDYSSGNRFPVIYMQDGQNLFDATTSISGEWQVDEILDSLHQYNGFSCIVVGIYNGEKQRLNEYSPWRNDSLKAGGDGDKYAKFIVKTLKPFIDSHYRTLTDRENTAIMGSSMGGLISLYIALEYPDFFGKAGIFSPSLGFSPKAFEMIQNNKQKKLQKFYLFSGTKEGVKNISYTLKTDSLLRSNGFDENYLRYKISKEGQLNESLWGCEFGNAIKFLFNL